GRHGDRALDRAWLVVGDVVAHVDADGGQLPAVAFRVHAQRHCRACRQPGEQEPERGGPEVAAAGGGGFVGDEVVCAGAQVDPERGRGGGGRADSAADVTHGRHWVGGPGVCTTTACPLRSLRTRDRRVRPHV